MASGDVMVAVWEEEERVGRAGNGPAAAAAVGPEAVMVIEGQSLLQATDRGPLQMAPRVLPLLDRATWKSDHIDRV